MGYAIVTRYAGPTNYRGSRVIATGPAPHLPAWDAAPGTTVPPTRATVGWDYGAGNADGQYPGWGDADANHRRAADACVAKLRAAGWTVSIAPDDRGATLPDDRGRVFALCYGDAPADPVAIIADALTGPAAGATARRIAPAVADNLAALGWRLTR